MYIQNYKTFKKKQRTKSLGFGIHQSVIKLDMKTYYKKEI